ncbi:cysteine--tRNA ligase [Aestuariivirga sp.]|jgi:cysteinyl-tRNA synthetase|uniref:cysteine--tRNA ligase n=1 Tax=Aestuariivirga sp. TaxID=2650926 RepID=UPI00378417EF
MRLRLHNTLTRTKDDFVPMDPKNVRMYVCGPTVWDYAHIGNARPVIVFDVLFRLLRQIYGVAHVKYVRNITDVDDKINARARADGIPIREVTERTTRQFHADIAALGVLPPTVEPRATEHISEMISIIERLIEAGHAYAADGHVLFDVPSMSDYGQLSRRSLDEMLAGARVDVAPYKRGEMDFVLWKPSDAETPGWDSPWGRGRPGWHIECSAMSWKHLGEVFDIHGGGIDLVFPHHENEIAQTRCAFGHRVMAQVWMHNGFLQVEGQKMSKSLGNFLTIHQLLADWPGDVLRFNMLRTHYRQPIDWTVKSLEESWRILEGFFNNAGSVHAEPGHIHASVLEALLDDLNTPKAIAELHALDRPGAQNDLGVTLKSLGFSGDLATPGADLTIDGAAVAALVEARLAARRARNWAESDRIRDELAAMGIAIKDNKDGTTTWEMKR